MRRLSCMVWPLVLVAHAAVAQTRDAAPRPTSGTATISGRVVNDEADAKPVRRAIITLQGAGLVPSRGAISDDDGRFAITGLPAGRFTLTAARAAFITSSWGAKRAGRPGTPVVVADGGTVANLVVRLWRGAAVAGTVRDEMGVPVPRVPVTALSSKPGTGVLTLSNNGVVTDERGEYRIFGLEPGAYIVRAAPTFGGTGTLTAQSEADVDALLAAARRGTAAPGLPSPPTPAPKPIDFAPMFYPGTPTLSAATAITLEPGSEAVGLDITLRRVSTAAVTGVVQRPDGSPAAGASVQLVLPAPAGAFASLGAQFINATADAAGAFRFGQVAPGDYTLVARASLAPPAPSADGPMRVSPGGRGPQIWAQTPLSVNSADIEGVGLRLMAAPVVTGRVVFDGTSPAPDATAVQLWLQLPDVPLRAGGSIEGLAFPLPVNARPDGTFEIPNVLPARYQLTVRLPDGVWSPRSAMPDDLDLLDGPFVYQGQTSPVVLTISDRQSEVSGLLTTAPGVSPDVSVIAYAADRARWVPGSRRVQSVRPDATGRYTVRGLPPGEYYVGVVTDVDADEIYDATFLDRLLPASAKIVLAAGEKRQLDLRLGGG